MIISIAIADKNREYIERLAEVLQQHNDLNISIFTNADRLFYALEREKFDILLFDPDLSEERITFSKVKMAVCLYSDEAENSEFYAETEKILKYQRISNIYKEIVKKYAEKAGYAAGFGDSRYTKAQAVYSPIGGSGKTIISIALAEKLAEYGRKVLFISTEQLSSSVVIFPYSEAGNTALIEALSGNTVFDLKLRGIAKSGKGGVSYIEGFDKIADFCDVTKEEMQDVLQNIKKCGMYDNLIIDMGSNMDEIGQAVWEEADEIIIVDKPGEFATQKIQFFANQGIVLENRNKMLKVHNFAESNSKYSTEFDVPEIGMIHNYGNLLESNIIHAINSSKEIDISRFL